jgi:hypothetical protein
VFQDQTAIRKISGNIGISDQEVADSTDLEKHKLVTSFDMRNKLYLKNPFK